MSRLAIQRAAVLLVAVVAIAWLALSLGHARTVDRVRAVAADPHPAPAKIEAALHDALAHRALDPDRAESLLYAAVLQIRAGRLAEARALLERVVRSEPDTAQAWLLLARLTEQDDPQRSAQAQARLRELDPLAAPPAR